MQAEGFPSASGVGKKIRSCGHQDVRGTGEVKVSWLRRCAPVWLSQAGSKRASLNESVECVAAAAPFESFRRTTMDRAVEKVRPSDKVKMDLLLAGGDWECSPTRMRGRAGGLFPRLRWCRGQLQLLT